LHEELGPRGDLLMRNLILLLDSHSLAANHVEHFGPSWEPIVSFLV
jgi:hypothetical protein